MRGCKVVNEAEIRKIIEASPLAARADDIMALAVPAVKMNTYLVDDDDDLPLGASRMGGAPDLPPEAVWPTTKGRPIEFLVQIDFAAAAEAYRLPGFPDRGWVALFRDLKSMEDGIYDDDDQWYWLNFDCTPTHLVHTEHPGEPVHSFNFCEVTFEPELCLPNDIHERFGGGDEALEEEAYEYFDSSVWDISNGPYHRLGGLPMLIQSDMEDYRGWDFLMQIDSDDEVGWMWGDAGRIYNWGKRKGCVARALAQNRKVAPLDRFFSTLFAEEEFF
jgi:uncharacterized protein YwqG